MIAVDLAGDFDRLHEDEVGASVRVRIGDGEGDRFLLGGLEALTFLTEVSFCGGQRLGKCFLTSSLVRPDKISDYIELISPLAVIRYNR